MIRMSGICEPMWKCRSLKALAIPASFRMSIASRISARGEAELRVLAGEVAHLPRPSTGRPDAHADQRLDASPSRCARSADLGELLHDEDDLLAELAPDERHADEGVVLVAVADDQRLVVAVDERPANISGLEPTSMP
jgi:hypothetical protein